MSTPLSNSFGLFSDHHSCCIRSTFAVHRKSSSEAERVALACDSNRSEHGAIFKARALIGGLYVRPPHSRMRSCAKAVLCRRRAQARRRTSQRPQTAKCCVPSTPLWTSIIQRLSLSRRRYVPISYCFHLLLLLAGLEYAERRLVARFTRIADARRSSEIFLSPKMASETKSHVSRVIQARRHAFYLFAAVGLLGLKFDERTSLDDACGYIKRKMRSASVVISVSYG